jgi:pyrimidine precursor biosynthesis enzyme
MVRIGALEYEALKKLTSPNFLFSTEPNDPSDVTEIIGSGKAELGLKAMVHTLAGAAMDYPITSLATVMDEPITGLVYLEGGLSGKDSSAVNSDFASLRGKRLGFVGKFGKVQIDELFQFYKVLKEDGTPDYTPVRCGMQIADSILNGTIDAGESLLRLILRRDQADFPLLEGIGLENVQTVELEEWCKSHGRLIEDVKMLRIDELAALGCCCFCS